ncbi:MAG: substrate-binding domain-containing protein [Verrucomicrobia bacterium]|nr:substrate-binding domain-containing protein [Verrucomicrobiota bacterium]
MKRKYLAFVFTLIITSAFHENLSALPLLQVAYAGSMGIVMDQFLGPAFAKIAQIEFQGTGHGAWGLAHLIESKQIRPDVFVSITPGPMRSLIAAGLVKEATPIASTQMVIAYSDKSRFARELTDAAAGKLSWWDVLKRPGFRFGRTDPAVDPQGRNIIFTFLLAEQFYHQPNLVRAILGEYVNPQQIFAEPSLLTRLESGQLDASSGYLSSTKSHHLPFVSLPEQINLSNPEYSSVGFELTGPDGKTQNVEAEPLVFYAAVLLNAAQPQHGNDFIRFLRSPIAQNLMRDNGYDSPKGEPLEQ